MGIHLHEHTPRKPNSLIGHSRVLRITGLLVILSLQLHAKAVSQEHITLNIKNASLETVLREIRKQTGYLYALQDQWKEKARPIDISVNDASLTEVLDLCFKDQPFTYTIIRKTIVVAPRNADTKPRAEMPGTRQPVTGVIKNEAGIPLAGATIEIKKLNLRGIANEKGEFILKGVPSGKYEVDITYVGYERYHAEIVVMDNELALSVRLRPAAASSLDEVQIVAYGTTTRRINTGDVSTVTSKTIEEQPVQNPLEALEGRVPGMFITQSTGMPGSAFTVQIRGQNSIANGNDPLYIVDGVPYSAELLNGLNPSGGNPLNFINPTDIASVDVLKDADATAIYGSRGANGVVLITTKKGVAGKTRADFNVYSGAGQITRKVKYLNTPQYLEMRREAFANDGTTPSGGDYDVNGTWDTTRYTDWQKMLIGGTAKYTDAQGSVSGGNANTQFVIGGGYHRQSTVFPGDLYDQKGSLHFNINNTSADERFNIRLSGNYTADNSNLIQADYTSFLTELPPDAPPVYNPDGTLNRANTTWPSGENPLAELRIKYKGNTTNLIANAQLSYKLLKGLDILTSLGYTSQELHETETVPTTYFDPAYGITSGSSYFTNNNIHSWIIEPQLKYEIALGKGRLQALAGSTLQQQNSNGQLLTATGYTSDALLQNLQAASSISVTLLTNTQYKYDALFGRLNYDWDGRYIINLTARRDGSSRFGPANQFANFGAVGAAWLFTKEEFIRNALPFLSFGKLRGSYGTNGNDQLGDYKFLNLYNSTTYPYQGTQALYPVNLYNPNLQWELNRKIEGALELGFLGDRILTTVAYYRNRSSNQLVSAGVSGVTGFASITQNLPALVQNTGVELSVTTVNVKSKSFRWGSTFTMSLPRNKLLSFPGLASSSYSTMYVVGQPLTVKRLYRFAGVNDTTGLYQFATAKNGVNGNPAYPDDLTAAVNTAPKFYGGFQNSFQYKQFSLDVFFQFVHQTGLEFQYGTLPGAEGNQQPVTVLSRWQKSGDHTHIQQFSESYGSQVFNQWLNAKLYSDQLYGSASYIRLKNLSFSYSLSPASLKRLHIDNLRIYLQGQNLLTITKYVGYDPENQSSQALPLLRVLTAGIELTL